MKNSCLKKIRVYLCNLWLKRKTYHCFVNKKMEALTPSASELVGRVANFTVRNSRKI